MKYPECHAEFNFVHLTGRGIIRQQGATKIPIPLSLLRYALYYIHSFLSAFVN